MNFVDFTLNGKSSKQKSESRRRLLPMLSWAVGRFLSEMHRCTQQESFNTIV